MSHLFRVDCVRCEATNSESLRQGDAQFIRNVLTVQFCDGDRESWAFDWRSSEL